MLTPLDLNSLFDLDVYFEKGLAASVGPPADLPPKAPRRPFKFRALEEEAYPQVIPEFDESHKARRPLGNFTNFHPRPESLQMKGGCSSASNVSHIISSQPTEFYLDHDSLLMQGAYSFESENAYIPLNEITVTGPDSATVIVNGPIFKGDAKETLARMNTDCLNSPGKTLDISIEVTDACHRTFGREIVSELLGIVKLSVKKLHLTVPENDDASFQNDLITSVPLELPALRRLSWKGDLGYIPSLLSNIPFSQLTSFSLESDASTDDCTEILYRCKNAAVFRVVAHKSRGSLMKHTFHDGQKSMKALEVLEISPPAMYDFVAGMFSFPALERSCLANPFSHCNMASNAISFGMQNFPQRVCVHNENLHRSFM